MIHAFKEIRLTNSFLNATGGVLKVNNELVTFQSETGRLLNYSGVLSDRLYQTGVNLISLINASAGGVSTLNGGSGNFNITGTGTVTVISGGVGLIYISGNNNDGINLSGNLTTTGQTLYNYIVNTSGNLDTRIYQTGSNLYNLINNFSGVFNNSGVAYQTQIDTLTNNLTTTGQNLYNWITVTSGNNNTTNSNLTVTGQTLHTRITNYSGNTQSFLTGMTTGWDNYRVDYPLGAFPIIPKIFTSLEISGNIMYNVCITGRSTSSFYALFSDVISESGVILFIQATINN